MEIFTAIDLTEPQIARMHEIAGDDVVHPFGYFTARDPVEPSFLSCEVAFGNVPAAWLTGNAELRWMQLESVGFDEYGDLDWDSLGQRLTVTNLAGFFADPVAESALAGILALCRGVGRLAKLQRDRKWLGEAFRPELRTLKGRTVVLFGYGAINRRLEELLEPFSCEIVAFGSDWRAEALDEALGHADIVVSTVPDRPGTRDVFDRRRIGLMPAGGLFLNYGRGSVVDEDALADALEEGRLGGAVADVSIEEPLPAGHRFWACPNLIVTQHTSGGTGDEIDRKIEHFAENLARYRAGETPHGVVDFSRGY